MPIFLTEKEYFGFVDYAIFSVQLNFTDMHENGMNLSNKIKNEELEKTSGVLLNVLLTAQPMNRKHNTVYTGADWLEKTQPNAASH